MPPRRGASLIGLLVALVCMLVLGVISMNALNKSMTGAGSTLKGTVASFEDQQYLSAIFAGLATDAHFREGRFLNPRDVAEGAGASLNTTAAFYSALIAQHSVVPGQLISANEYSPYVWRDEDYDYTSYDPARGSFWDPGFSANLVYDSNVSFAHMPLYGQRLDRQWKFNADSRTVLLGNRGPKDGIDDPASYAYGRSGVWGGQIVFGDGHVEFFSTFTPAGLVILGDGAQQPDNVFNMQEGPEGMDAILAFTQEMTEEGPVLQFD